MILIAELAWLLAAIAALVGLAAGYWAFARTARPSEAIPAAAAAPQPAVAEPEPPPIEVPAADGPPDDLETLKGVGPRLAAMLGEQGISRFSQLAALTPDALAALDARLGNFAGRLARDRVAEQADLLARGDRDEFERRFGNLGSGS